MNARINLIFATLGLAAAITLAAPPARAVPLVDSRFDSPAPLRTFAAVVVPFNVGEWGVEVATKVGPTLGVTPESSPNMLQMLNDGLTLTQAGQAFVASPGESYTLSYDFTTGNDAMGNPVSGAVAGVILSFFATANSWDTPISPECLAQKPLNSNPADWETVSVTCVSPALTTWGLAQVFYNDASLGTSAGFVDLPVPEPASIAMLGVGLLGLFLALRKDRITR